jgi:hypothetical protein
MAVTLGQLEQVVRSCFARDTCSPDDLSEWSEGNRSRGHCAVTTLTLNDMLGGELLCAEVRVGSTRIGYHWWNRIGDTEIDFTRDQFAAHEIIGQPWVARRPPGNDHFYGAQHALFAQRVNSALDELLGISPQFAG